MSLPAGHSQGQGRCTHEFRGLPFQITINTYIHTYIHTYIQILCSWSLLFWFLIYEQGTVADRDAAIANLEVSIADNHQHLHTYIQTYIHARIHTYKLLRHTCRLWCLLTVCTYVEYAAGYSRWEECHCRGEGCHHRRFGGSNFLLFCTLISSHIIWKL